jgi:Cys-tRNA(Pro)/Cys-tRNA(Cys) deacylase
VSTPAIRILDAAGTSYRLHEYDLDPAAKSLGLEAAAKLRLPPERVFKTLVVAVAEGHVLAVVPVHDRLDPKVLGKRARLADPAEAERVTGYVKGGTSVLGGRKRLPVVLDASAAALPTMFCSAGRRGLEMELAPADLAALADARFAPIAG